MGSLPQPATDPLRSMIDGNFISCCFHGTSHNYVVEANFTRGGLPRLMEESGLLGCPKYLFL